MFRMAPPGRVSNGLTSRLLSPHIFRLTLALSAILVVGLLFPGTQALAAEAPTIGNVSVSGITEHDATLEAQINPNGLETSYRFRLEYGCLPPRECLWIGVIRVPPEEIPASYEAHSVSVDLNGSGVTLHSGTEYRYSVEATNLAGTTEGPTPIEGPGHTFTTPAASLPLIESESVSHLTSTDATLEAQINTEGLETTYEFHLLTAPLCFEANPPCERPQNLFPLPSGTLLGSFVGQSVSVQLNSAGVSVAPSERYEYWVTATNTAGTVEGHHQSFTAPEAAVQPAATGPAQNASHGTITPTATNPVGNVTPLPKATVLTNSQKHVKAVRPCKKKPKKRRASCQKRIRKKYGTTATKAKKR